MLFLFANREERDKFEYLYTRYKGLLLHKAQGILHDPMLAEDAVSEAFIRVYRNLHKIGGADTPQTVSFLVTIVRNTALTILSKQHRGEAELTDDIAAGGEGLEGQVVSELSEGAMLALVSRLGDDLRAVFLLRYAHGLSGREIANALGISESNVNVRLHRARGRLAGWLREEGLVYDAI